MSLDFVGFETLPENMKLIDKHVYLLISGFFGRVSKPSLNRRF